MPQQNLSSDEEDEIDEREEIVPLEKKSSAPEEEKGDLESARGKGASPRKDNDMTMDEENLVDMINEMKQIVTPYKRNNSTG